MGPSPSSTPPPGAGSGAAIGRRRRAPFWRRAADDVRRRLGGTTTAFVLSGGGNLGPVQVGMLRALAEAGVEPDLIVGCSVGAINGAGFAADPTDAGVDRLDRIWRRIATGDPDLMPSRLIPVVAQMARKGEAMHDQSRLADLLDDELPTKTFSGLQIPFSCVATDLETATEHWFSSGRLVPALLASAALPAVYPAFEHRGRTFIDGGVLNEIHTAQALALGATELYVLHVGHLEERPLDVQRPFDSAMRAYWTARRFRLAENLRQVPDHCVVHRLPAGSNPRLRFDDFSQAAELAELAYDASSQFLATGEAPTPVSGPVSTPAPDDVEAYEQGEGDEQDVEELQPQPDGPELLGRFPGVDPYETDGGPSVDQSDGGGAVEETERGSDGLARVTIDSGLERLGRVLTRRTTTGSDQQGPGSDPVDR